MYEVWLTTFDNPWNPFTNRDEWLLEDINLGHNCCEIVGKLAFTSDQYSDEENTEEVERAIDEFIKHDPFNIYRKVRSDEKFEDLSQENFLVESEPPSGVSDEK